MKHLAIIGSKLKISIREIDDSNRKVKGSIVNVIDRKESETTLILEHINNYIEKTKFDSLMIHVDDKVANAFRNNQDEIKSYYSINGACISRLEVEAWNTLFRHCRRWNIYIANIDKSLIRKDDISAIIKSELRGMRKALSWDKDTFYKVELKPYEAKIETTMLDFNKKRSTSFSYGDIYNESDSEYYGLEL